MLDSHTFAVDVVQIIGDRLATQAAELGFLIETNTSFAEWLACEAFLACKLRQASYPFCEVAAKPTYTSESVEDDGSKSGDLRVGGPDEGANHCWAFIEFAIHDDAAATSGKLQAAVERLKRLGWKKSAALLIIVAISQGADTWATSEIWNQPPLTAPLVMALPNGGTAILKAFDIKRDPTHILSALGGH